jgi:uncharacterized SAM-binding protein YcdF (DUF218 family)
LIATFYITIAQPEFAQALGRPFAAVLEACFSAVDPSGNETAIIALGGDNQRVSEAIRLAYRFRSAKLVLSGKNETKGTELLKASGIARERVIFEAGSRSTHENAVFSARMLKPRSDETWILVTSATHMPRAVGTFRKAGFNIHPWPVIYHPPDIRLSLRVALHEWVGLIGYRLLGRSSELVPCSRPLMLTGPERP